MRFTKTIGITATAVAVLGGLALAAPASAGSPRNCFPGNSSTAGTVTCLSDGPGYVWRAAADCYQVRGILVYFLGTVKSTGTLHDAGSLTTTNCTSQWPTTTKVDNVRAVRA